MIKKKQWLALLLCICMIAGIFPSSIISKAETSSDVSADETKLYTLNGEDYILAYEDDFSNSEKYTEALGKYAGDTYSIPWNQADGNLKHTGTGLVRSFFDGLDNAATMQNYTISADVTLGASNSYVEIASYASGEVDKDSTSEYAFLIFWKNGKPWTRLLYRNGSDTTIYNETNLVNLLGLTAEEAVGVGQKFTLRMTTVTNGDGSVQLTCYAKHDDTEKQVYDGAVTGGPTCGAPGIRTQQSNAVYDNVKVVKQVAEDTAYLYKDDFETNKKYIAALGHYAVDVYTIPWDKESKSLKLTGNAGRVYFDGLDNASELRNYTISADVTPALSSSYVAVTAYGSGPEDSMNTTEYAFMITWNTNVPRFRLLRRVNGTATQIGGDSLLKNNGIGIDDTAIGKTINLSMSVITNTDQSVQLICYATCNGTTIKVFDETVDATTASTNGLTCGAPGIRTQQTGVVYDNIRVTQSVQKPIIYGDEFNVQEGYTVALGDYAGDTYIIPWNGADQNLKHTSEENIVGRSFFDGLDNASTMQNYKISADVTLGDDSSYAAITSYSSGEVDSNSTTEYDFMITWKNSKPYARLRYRNGSSSSTIDGAGDVNLVTLLGMTDEEAVGVGQKFTLRMSTLANTDGSVQLICYAAHNDTEKLVYDVTAKVNDTNVSLTCGAPGIRTQQPNAVYDNIRVEQMPDNYMAISPYRNNGEYTAPTKEGYVFGGWYTDASFETPLGTDVKTGAAYAKWVEDDVLSVKAQLDSKTTAESVTTAMRFVTTVNCFDYENIYFVINGNKFGNTTTVYSKLLARDDMGAWEYKPAVFSQKSIRFAAVTLSGIPLFNDANGNGTYDEGETDYREKPITITPYWKTADGTVVEGVECEKTIQQGLAVNAGQPFSL